VDTREPELAELAIADPPGSWRALGFTVDEDGNLDLGGIRMRLGEQDRDGWNGRTRPGITAWSLRGVNAMGSIDGLASPVPRVLRPPPFATHPNGATGLDHVVVVTSDFNRTADALKRAGMPLRRTRESDRGRQGFRRLGPAILELVHAPDLDGGAARFWGLAIVVISLEDLAERLGDRLSEIRPAVQPGRRIATLRRSGSGVSPFVAFMSPEPP
jgi:hypothetical protein